MAKEFLSSNELETNNDFSLRPNYLLYFVGQEHIKSNLNVFIQAANNKKKP